MSQSPFYLKPILHKPGLVTSLFITIALSTSAVRAGEGGPGLISDVHFMQNGVVIMNVAGGHTGYPACGQTYVGRWAFNGTTPEGKLRTAGLLSAYAMGKKIKVYGTNA